jgi:hypothetical protein
MLLPRLRDEFDVELVVSATATVARGFGNGLRVLRPSEIWNRHLADPFDLFVYHLQDRGSHQYLLELLRWRSGLAVVHDAAPPGPGRDGCARVLAVSDAVIVHGRAAWEPMRSRTRTPVFCVPDDAAAAAAAYAAAIRLTMARRTWRDGEWCDAASAALAGAAGSGAAVDDLIEGWARLRTAARRAGIATRGEDERATGFP